MAVSREHGNDTLNKGGGFKSSRTGASKPSIPRVSRIMKAHISPQRLQQITVAALLHTQ